MIGGYPHDAGGMLDVACASIEKRLSRPVRSMVVSLGGFPAPRAEKHLKRKVLDFNPHYVVIQFASTDAQCPVRKSSRPKSTNDGPTGLSKPSSSWDSSYHLRTATVVSSLRWKLASLIGWVQGLDPITPLPLHLAAIERMIGECKEAGATPIVLSPFVYGSRYTTRSAANYTNSLDDLARARGFRFVDCMQELSSRAKREILQHDGFHLSRIGQRIIGQAIANSIVVAAANSDAAAVANPT